MAFHSLSLLAYGLPLPSLSLLADGVPFLSLLAYGLPLPQPACMPTCMPFHFLSLLAYGPLAGGTLSGKYHDKHAPVEKSRHTLFPEFQSR